MVLSRPDILEYLKSERLRFEPAVPETSIEQVSVDLRLGHKFTTFKKFPGYITSIHVDPALWDSDDLWDRQTRDTFTLAPGEFVLAHTLERVSIPHDLVGFVEGRSSWARVGVSIHITAPKIDPGFQGHITLEMMNVGKAPVELRAEVDRPAQLMLMQLSKPLSEGEAYGSKSTDTFQFQEDPIPASDRSEGC